MAAELLQYSIASFCIHWFIFVFSKNLFVINNSYFCSLKINYVHGEIFWNNLPQVKFLLFHTGLYFLAVSETHLSPTLESHEIAIQGYQIQRRARLGKSGSRVVVYFKDSLDCMSIAKWDNCGIEATWLEVSVKSQRLLVGCIYRPPDFEDFYDKYLPILVRISVDRKNVIITGDFNSNMQDNSRNGKKFRNILKRVHLKQLIWRFEQCNQTK